MINLLRKTAFHAIIIICFVSLCGTIFAAAAPGGEDRPVSCAFTIRISDDTDGEFDDVIDVTLKDIAAGATYYFILNFENVYFGFTSSAFIFADTTYQVTFSYPSSHKYKIYNRLDGTEVDRLAATESGYTADWVIRKADITKPDTVFDIDTGNAEADAANSDTVFNIETGNAEADAVFKQFYNAVKHMDGNSAWDNFYLTYGIAYEKKHAEKFVEYCSGTEEEWFAKSMFERFIWHETYLRLLGNLYAGNYDWYFSNEKTFLDNTISNTYRNLITYGNGLEAEAYKTLMLWQYNHLISTGTVYNFLTGVNHIEYSSEITTTGPDNDIENSIVLNLRDPDKERETAMEREQEEIKEAFSELELDSADVPLGNAEPGIWDMTVSRIKDNALTFGILLLVLGVLTVVILYRKSKAIIKDDES